MQLPTDENIPQYNPSFAMDEELEYGATKLNIGPRSKKVHCFNCYDICILQSYVKTEKLCMKCQSHGENIVKWWKQRIRKNIV